MKAKTRQRRALTVCRLVNKLRGSKINKDIATAMSNFQPLLSYKIGVESGSKFIYRLTLCFLPPK